MKFAELITEKGSGIETWPVSNMNGHVKKFRKIDGWWEKPVEVERWMKGHESPVTAYERDVARDRRQAEKNIRDEERAERQAAREKKRNRPSDFDIVAAGEDAIGQSFPDGDPSDHIRPYLEKHGLEWSDVNVAFKKVHKKEFYKYLADMWDDHAADALHDAKQGHHGEHYDNQWFAQGNPWK